MGDAIYQGRSLLTGEPIVAITTDASRNRKTGSMVQTWILRADAEPTAVIREGSDGAVCGDCRHRSVASGGSGACYVNVGQAPLAVWRAWQRGRYERVRTMRGLASIGAGKAVRLGSYGDPAAVPVWVWRALVSRARSHTGYTHQWRRAPELRSLCRASVDSHAERLEALADAWSTFRVAAKDATRDDAQRGEALCPASEPAGKRTTCASCPIGCSGASRLNVWIPAHGSTAGRVSV